MKGQYIYAWDFNNLTWDTVPNSYLGTSGGLFSSCVDNNNDLIIGSNVVVNMNVCY